MTENQKLRESIKRLLKAHRITVQAPPKTITDAENQIAEIQNAVKFAEEALALPTAAPVGDLPELPELPEPAAWRTPDEWPMCYQYTHEGPDAERIQWAARYGRKHEQVFTADQMRAYALSARAALSAGDAVDAQRTPLTFDQITELDDKVLQRVKNGNDPNIDVAVLFAREIERAHGIDAAMRKGQL